MQPYKRFPTVIIIEKPNTRLLANKKNKNIKKAMKPHLSI